MVSDEIKSSCNLYTSNYIAYHGRGMENVTLYVTSLALLTDAGDHTHACVLYLMTLTNSWA